MYFGLQLEGTVHHDWKGMVLRAVLALRAREEIRHIAPSQEAERREQSAFSFLFSLAPGPPDGATHTQDGFFPSQLNFSGNSLTDSPTCVS